MNPRLCDSAPVFQVNTTRFAPFLSVLECAEKDCNEIFVGAVTVSIHVDVLFAELGSDWSAFTMAVLENIPGVLGIVRIEIVAVPPLAIEPNRQATVPPASEHDPCVVFDDRYVMTVGTASVTVTFVAVAGPLLVTRSV